MTIGYAGWVRGNKDFGLSGDLRSKKLAELCSRVNHLRMDDRYAIPKCKTVQIFLECLLGQFTPETIHRTLNHIQWACTAFLAICCQTGALFTIPAIKNRGLKVIGSLALNHHAPFEDMLPTEANPNIPHWKSPRRPVQKGNEFSFACINNAREP